MALAYGVADLAVCRSGASTLAEFPLFGLPSVLIPLAYSWRYQQVNADYLQAHGAGIHLNETEMDMQLLPILQDLLHQPEKLEMMKNKAQALARPDGAKNIANLLLQLAGKTA
jgi:UDP-N-acetylglucosamine--N-acetylmuramyl-(pentapeptide) pyrophosphoryl-undecaprenol N-acetylglucosamine transferase